MSRSARHNLKTKIARIIFENLRDIDGDMADWLHFQDELEDAAQEILDQFMVNPKKK